MTSNTGCIFQHILIHVSRIRCRFAQMRSSAQICTLLTLAWLLCFVFFVRSQICFDKTMEEVEGFLALLSRFVTKMTDLIDGPCLCGHVYAATPHVCRITSNTAQLFQRFSITHVLLQVLIRVSAERKIHWRTDQIRWRGDRPVFGVFFGNFPGFYGFFWGGLGVRR